VRVLAAPAYRSRGQKIWLARKSIHGIQLQAFTALGGTERRRDHGLGVRTICLFPAYSGDHNEFVGVGDVRKQLRARFSDE
jgi:hypothetical protein